MQRYKIVLWGNYIYILNTYNRQIKYIYSFKYYLITNDIFSSETLRNIKYPILNNVQ